MPGVACSSQHHQLRTTSPLTVGLFLRIPRYHLPAFFCFYSVPQRCLNSKHQGDKFRLPHRTCTVSRNIVSRIEESSRTPLVLWMSADRKHGVLNVREEHTRDTTCTTQELHSTYIQQCVCVCVFPVNKPPLLPVEIRHNK